MNEADIKQHVGLKIKRYRQKSKLTQFKLGELIDINQRQVAQIECGKSFPSLPTLLKLSQVLHRDISDFLAPETEISEKDLKNILIEKIKQADYNDCKRLLSIVKTFMEI